MRFRNKRVRNISRSKRVSLSVSPTSFKYTFEAKRNLLNAQSMEQERSSPLKLGSKSSEIRNRNSPMNNDEACPVNTSTATERSDESRSRKKFWTSFPRVWNWSSRIRRRPAADSPRLSPPSRARTFAEYLDLPSGVLDWGPPETRIRVSKSDNPRHYSQIRSRKDFQETKDKRAYRGYSLEDDRSTRIADFSTDPTKATPSRRRFVLKGGAASTNTEEHAERKSIKGNVKEGFLDLASIRERTREKQNKELGFEEVSSKQDEQRSRKQKRFHKFTSKLKITPHRASENMRRTLEKRGTSKTDRSVPPDATDDGEKVAEPLSWTQITRLKLDNMLQKGLRSHERSQRLSYNAFGKRAGSCPVSDRHGNTGLASSITSRRRGFIRQSSADDWRSLRTGSLGNTCYRKSKVTRRMSDLESPWGVKGEVSLEGQSLESRQMSKSLLGINMSDILSAMNTAFIKKCANPSSENDFLISGDGTQEAEESGSGKRSKEDFAEIEMFHDPFLDYTIRAKQSSNRTLVSRFRRKSTVG